MFVITMHMILWLLWLCKSFIIFSCGAQRWGKLPGDDRFKGLKYDHSMLGHDYLVPEKAHSGLKSLALVMVAAAAAGLVVVSM